jgi:hypothetical protein
VPFPKQPPKPGPSVMAGLEKQKAQAEALQRHKPKRTESGEVPAATPRDTGWNGT